jgi:hypothetical protein
MPSSSAVVVWATAIAAVVTRGNRRHQFWPVEFQQVSYERFHPGAESRTSRGRGRNEAYRRFLADLTEGCRLSARGRPTTRPLVLLNPGSRRTSPARAMCTEGQ